MSRPTLKQCVSGKYEDGDGRYIDSIPTLFGKIGLPDDTIKTKVKEVADKVNSEPSTETETPLKPEDVLCALWLIAELVEYDATHLKAERDAKLTGDQARLQSELDRMEDKTTEGALRLVSRIGYLGMGIGNS